MDKKIQIFGKTNRYQIKKLISEPLRNELKTVTTGAIQKKMSGYKMQDKKRGLVPNIQIDDIMTLLNTKVCHYCGIEVLLSYETKLHPQQWTLDRIDNNLPHNADNVVLSCLKCNLERRKKNFDKFLFTKTLNVVKT